MSNCLRGDWWGSYREPSLEPVTFVAGCCFIQVTFDPANGIQLSGCFLTGHKRRTIMPGETEFDALSNLVYQMAREPLSRLCLN